MNVSGFEGKIKKLPFPGAKVMLLIGNFIITSTKAKKKELRRWIVSLAYWIENKQ